MSDSKIKAKKPQAVKPKAITTQPIKPKPIKPMKAHGKLLYNPNYCVRCDCEINEQSGRVAALCSACDYDLQVMHHSCEVIVHKKTVYVQSRVELLYLRDFVHSQGGELKFPREPYKRNNFGKVRAVEAGNGNGQVSS